VEHVSSGHLAPDPHRLGLRGGGPFAHTGGLACSKSIGSALTVTDGLLISRGVFLHVTGSLAYSDTKSIGSELTAGVSFIRTDGLFISYGVFL
jgi:hypothetical protein